MYHQGVSDAHPRPLCPVAIRPEHYVAEIEPDADRFAGRSVGQWFNAAAFTAAPQFTIGTSSRNPIRGPGLQNADVMIGKTFRLTERIHLEFRAEAFNILNHPNFTQPVNNITASTFGQILATRTARGDLGSSRRPL